MSVRKVHTNGKTVVGYINSKKNLHEIQFESLLEKEFLFLLQFDSKVVYIDDQPVKIFFESGGKKHTYVPDFLVKYSDGKEVLFEVKYESDLEKNSRKYAARFKAAKKYAASEGKMFRIITDKEIRTQYKDNVNFLITFRNSSADLELQHSILKVLQEKRVASFLEIMKTITDAPAQQRALIRPFWVLIWKHVITANMFERVTLESKVWIANEKHPVIQLPFPYHRLPKINPPRL